MEMIRRMFGMERKIDYKARSEAQDTMIREYSDRNRALIEKNKNLAELCSSEMVKLGQAKDDIDMLTSAAADLDAQVSDLHARIQRIAVAFKTAPSTKRMSMADKEAILRVIFDVPDLPAAK